jgi:hypothetical protein
VSDSAVGTPGKPSTCKKTALLSFPYVRPEPVLAK